jgi:hypothetical protein
MVSKGSETSETMSNQTTHLRKSAMDEAELRMRTEEGQRCTPDAAAYVNDQTSWGKLAPGKT